MRISHGLDQQGHEQGLVSVTRQRASNDTKSLARKEESGSDPVKDSFVEQFTVIKRSVVANHGKCGTHCESNKVTSCHGCIASIKRLFVYQNARDRNVAEENSSIVIGASSSRIGQISIAEKVERVGAEHLEELTYGNLFIWCANFGHG